MTRSPLRLLDWPVPTVRQRYTRRDTALYALSVCVGRNPLDQRALRLVDPWSDALQALPSLALVLGYPGFWLGEREVLEATGVVPAQILHAEQAVTLAAPLPPEGEVLGETRVTAIVDKGAERGSLLYSERRILEARSGSLLATCSQVHFLRRAGGFGSAGQPPAAPRAEPPQGAPRSQAETPTLAQQALLYRLNGDANALHLDPQLAAAAGFARPILHGTCTAAMAVTAVIELIADGDPSRVTGFSVRMTSPVLPGDILRTEVWPDGSFRTHALQQGSVVLDNGRVQLERN
ncbi:MAG: MaoC/PaaZ C-terminal domain-containing protein [Lautropia sp.]